MSTGIVTIQHHEEFRIQHPENNCSKKTVLFEPYTEVWTIDSYPKYLHEDLWYSKQNYQDIKIRNSIDVQEALLFGNADNIFFRPSRYRGLERTLDENRKLNMFRSIQSVLMEQHRQQLKQEHNLQAVANVYRANCISSVEKALRLAKIDAQDAQQAMSKTWMQQGGGTDDNVRCMESDTTSYSSLISDSDSLQVFQEKKRNKTTTRRTKMWILLRPEKPLSDEKKKCSEKAESLVNESSASHPNRWFMNLLARMMPTCG
jgi:hypothetical protein